MSSCCNNLVAIMNSLSSSLVILLDLKFSSLDINIATAAFLCFLFAWTENDREYTIYLRDLTLHNLGAHQTVSVCLLFLHLMMSLRSHRS